IMDHEQELDKTDDKDSPFPPVICYRDPADVRTIRRQSRLLLLALFITATAVVGVVYKSIQHPDRIVVAMSSGPTGHDQRPRARSNRSSQARERQAANRGHGLCSQDLPRLPLPSRSALACQRHRSRAAVDGAGPSKKVCAVSDRTKSPANTTRAAMERGLESR